MSDKMFDVDVKERESAILVGMQRRNSPLWVVNDNLDELEQLVHTAGGIPEARMVQTRGNPSASTFLTKGKVEELKNMIALFGANLVVFDDDLSPAQVKNLERNLECPVIDRSGLILDIFATRARTVEARIQVEIAQIEYMAPRLTGRWKHLGRQVVGSSGAGGGSGGTSGAIGTRGPGEKQIEIDKRVNEKRTTQLRRELAKIELARANRRKKREELFKVALVGYTNAGKSTILNALTNSNVFVQDLLFATLDPTVRSMYLPNGKKALLIDTVGFIRKLPVGLLASFRSTLEESITADLLVNVIDLSHPHWEEQYSRTEEIIKELELDKTPQITVFNKVDLVTDPILLEGMRRQFPEAIFISAERRIRLYELPERIAEFAETKWVRGTRAFTPEEVDELKRFEAQVKILGRTFHDGMIIVDYLVKVEGGEEEEPAVL